MGKVGKNRSTRLIIASRWSTLIYAWWPLNSEISTKIRFTLQKLGEKSLYVLWPQGGTTLTLSGREPVYKRIWTKI